MPARYPSQLSLTTNICH